MPSQHKRGQRSADVPWWKLNFQPDEVLIHSELRFARSTPPSLRTSLTYVTCQTSSPQRPDLAPVHACVERTGLEGQNVGPPVNATGCAELEEVGGQQRLHVAAVKARTRTPQRFPQAAQLFGLPPCPSPGFSGVPSLDAARLRGPPA